jgi:cell wall-associated NlpC family hydrolase
MKPVLLLLVLLFSACATVNEGANPPFGSTAAKHISIYARNLLGTPYKYGGNSPDTGFDCSGFVDYVFRHTVGIRLPRSSYEISHLGHAVKRGELSTGDLVFFNTLHRKFSHVGIYLGNERFIHAPSSGGKVRTEDMREAYWQSHYDGARRIALRS